MRSPRGALQIPPLRYAPVGMTILFENGFPRFHEGSVELQIPPLRYASVGMTKGRAAFLLRISCVDGRNSRSPFDFAQGRLSTAVGMTKGRAALPLRFDAAADEQQVPVRLRSGQALHYATPDFLWNLMALVDLMGLSLTERRIEFVEPLSSTGNRGYGAPHALWMGKVRMGPP